MAWKIKGRKSGAEQAAKPGAKPGAGQIGVRGRLFLSFAVIVALSIAGLLVAGTRESATVNIVLVVVKLTALAAFVLLALPFFDAEAYHHRLQQRFDLHYEGDASPPAQNHWLYSVLYEAANRLDIRQAIERELFNWAAGYNQPD